MYEAPDRYQADDFGAPSGRRIARADQPRRRWRKLAAARRPADLARPARAILRRRQHRRGADDGRRSCGARSTSTWLLAWCGAVALGQPRRDAARPHPGDHPRRPLGPPGAAMADGRRSRAARRAVAQPAALPCSPALDPGTQVIAASVMAGLGIGALGLVVVPPCVTAWMSAFTAGVSVALLHRPRARSRSSTCCRSCSRSASRFSACSPSPAGRSTSSRPTPTSARRAKAPACCCRNMSSAASAGCGRSMPKIASPTSRSRMTALLGRPASAAARPFAALAARRQCRARPRCCSSASRSTRSKWN